MNKIIILLLIFSSSYSIAQRKTILPLNVENNLIQFDSIIQFEGVSKEKLQSKVVEWIAINYKSANDVIQMNDKENGTIIAKGVYPKVIWGPVIGGAWDVSHTLTIRVKEGRIKITLDNFKYIEEPNPYNKGGSSPLEKLLILKTNKLLPKQIKNFESDLNKRILDALASIKEFINKSQKNEDW